MGLAGEGERHHGAAVESVFEGDDAGALGVGTSDLDCILDGLCAAVHEDCFLCKFSRRDFVHALGEVDVTLVGRNLDTGVQKVVELILDGFDDSFLTMTDVKAPDATREIEIAVAVNVFEPGVFGLCNVNRRAVGKAAGHGFGAALGEGAGFWSGNCGAKLNGRHLEFQFSVLSSQ